MNILGIIKSRINNLRAQRTQENIAEYDMAIIELLSLYDIVSDALRQAPTVYGEVKFPSAPDLLFFKTPAGDKVSGVTHSAKLINIEPIKESR